MLPHPSIFPDHLAPGLSSCCQLWLGGADRDLASAVVGGRLYRATVSVIAELTDVARHLPLSRDIHNALAKAQLDLEWAVRIFHESGAHEAVDIPRLVQAIEDALIAAKTQRIAEKTCP